MRGAGPGKGAELDAGGAALGVLGKVEWGPRQWRGGLWKGSKGMVGRGPGWVGLGLLGSKGRRLN